MRKLISIIICTCNRDKSLRKTMAAIGRVAIPPDLTTELLVVNNGFGDGTEKIVRSTLLKNMAVLYLLEPRQGKGYAYNTGLAYAKGSVLLFTDDDVRPGINWVEAMCQPIIRGEADAISGQVRIPRHLMRSWMNLWHRARMAEVGVEAPETLIVGANMAFGRHILDSVPLFDIELGPGALGLHEEGLFGRQLRLAGFRVARGGEDSIVEHHFGKDRLYASAWRKLAASSGRSMAYLDYHWEHKDFSASFRRLLRAWIELWVLRTRERGWFRTEGISEDEWNQLSWLAYICQMRLEQKRKKNYDIRGLRKLRGLLYHPLLSLTNEK